MHSTLRPSRNQSSHVTLSDPGNRCACPGCHLPRLQRLEEFNAQLARSNDALRRERDRLAERLAGKEAA
jgi:hypothetical protein